MECLLQDCLNGEFVRLGPKPKFEPVAGYHFFLYLEGGRGLSGPFLELRHQWLRGFFHLTKNVVWKKKRKQSRTFGDLVDFI